MDNQELIRKIFELVKQELLRINKDSMVECVKASEYVPEHCGVCNSSEVIKYEVSKNVISESDVKNALANSAGEIIISSKAIVTCLADEYARKHSITIVRKT